MEKKVKKGCDFEYLDWMRKPKFQSWIVLLLYLLHCTGSALFFVLLGWLIFLSNGVASYYVLLVSPSIPRKAHKTLNHHVRQSVVSWGQPSWNSVSTCSNEVLIFCFASFSFPPFFSFLAHGSLGSRDAKEKPGYTLYSFWSDILASQIIYVPFWWNDEK